MSGDTVENGTGKTDPARKSKCTTAAREEIINQWPNLKNLSGGSNLSRGLNMVGST